MFLTSTRWGEAASGGRGCLAITLGYILAQVREKKTLPEDSGQG